MIKMLQLYCSGVFHIKDYSPTVPEKLDIYLSWKLKTVCDKNNKKKKIDLSSHMKHSVLNTLWTLASSEVLPLVLTDGLI